MFKNYLDAAEVKNRNNKVPKNNYFAHKWRVKDNFSKSIDRELFHQNVMGATQYKTLMNGKILSLYKSRYNRSRSDLIVDLAHKAMIFLEKRHYQQVTNAQTEVLLTQHTRGLVDRVYNTLYAFTTELNSLLGLSELFVTATEPALLGGKENGRPTVDSKILARFSTNQFSLYIEGTKDRVQFYVLPADDLLALVDVSIDYQPACAWEAKLLKNEKVQWRDKNGLLTDELLEVTCVELLNKLLEKTKERLMPSRLVAEAKGANFEYNAPDPWEIDQHRTMESTTLIREHVAQSDVGTTTSWNHPVLDCKSSWSNRLLESTSALNNLKAASNDGPDSTASAILCAPEPTISAEHTCKESSYRWNGREYEVELSSNEDVSVTVGDIETVAKGSPTKKKTASSTKRGSRRKRRR